MKSFISTKTSAFFYACFSTFNFNLVGRLALGDIIAAVSVIFSVKKWMAVLNVFHDIKKIVTLLFCYLIIQLISDIINENTLVNSARGLANIAMAIIVILYLTKVLAKEFYIIYVIFFGLSISNLLFGPEIVKNHVSSIYDMGFFKFRVVPIINYFLFGLILYLSYKKKVKFSNKKIGSVFVIYGLFCLFLDARSNGLYFIIAGLLNMYLFVFKYLKRKYIIWIGAFLLFVFLGLYFVYVNSVLTGAIKSEHTKKQLLRIENPYNPISFLASGRKEIFASVIAISESPIIGHGSWAKDKNGRFNQILAERSGEEDRFNYLIENNGDSNFIIPTHSVFTGSWVSGGFFCFLMIVLIFYVYISNVIKIIKNPKFRKSVIFPIFCVLTLQLIWIFFFSPLSSLKNGVPLILVFTLILSQKLNTYLYNETVN